MHTSVIFFSCACNRAPRREKCHHSAGAPGAFSAFGEAANQCQAAVDDAKKIIVFGSKSRLALLQNEKTGAKKRNSRCYGGFSKGFKGSLREFV